MKKPLTPTQRQLIESHNAMIADGKAGITFKPNKKDMKPLSESPLFETLNPRPHELGLFEK